MTMPTKKDTPSRQTRRSISVKGITYQRLKDHCDAQGRSMSGWLEEVIAQKMDEMKVPIPTKIDPPQKTRKAKSRDEIISQHFTF